MPQKKRLLRGLDDFQKLIEGGGYFVDKTLLIKEVLDDEHQVVLLPRPRRFGKSLNLSMLANFFDITQPNNQHLFEPYKIWKTGERYTKQRGKYPVIQLSLKDIKESTYKDSLEFFRVILSELYLKHDYILEGKALRAKEKKDFEEVVNEEVGNVKIQSALKKLSGYLQRYHQQPVVILVDEYDSPIHTAYQNGYYKKMVSFMKSFLGGALKSNEALYKGVITGILRVSKESIFSDLNNIKTYSVLNHSFADKFGFTESETKAILRHFGLKDDFDLIKKWYDGYKVGKVTDVYNPWSITGYIGSHSEGFGAHWVNTSSDELIKERIIEKGAKDIRSDIEVLLSGKTISKPIEENMVFDDFYKQKELLWSLLLYSGYLTAVGKDESHVNIYQLKIPNYEIKTLFQHIIWNWFEVGLKITTSLLLKMVKSLTENRIEKFEKYFQEIMGDTFSYFDVTKNPEDVWQAYILGLLAISGEDYIIKSNRESGAGRYDILMLPKVKTKYGVLMEIKTMDKDATQPQIDAKLEEALEQIEKNEYYKELIVQGIPKRIEIAMVFAGKKVYMRPKQGDSN